MNSRRHITGASIALALGLRALLCFPLLAKGRGDDLVNGPDAQLSAILGRPTDHAITVSLLSANAIEASIEYGTKSGDYPNRTEPRMLKAGTPQEFELASLAPDTRYHYRVLTRTPGKGDFKPGPEASFQTQRLPGSTFTFALQGDSHPEREGKMFSPALYALTMRNVAANPPDFYITMGDDFSIERLIGSRAISQSAVNEVYAHQRSYLGVIGQSSALFLVNGNHEQAAKANLDGTAGNPAACAARAREQFFPLPAPGGFYTGDADRVPEVGLLRDYYAWTWGDALFVVIDPYWHSSVTVDNEAGTRQHGGESNNEKGGKGGKRDKGEKGAGKGSRNRDLWGITLGDAQYQWLVKTLTESKARWKFVFTHHVLGTGRGGIECAPFFEWGGRDRGGSATFAEKRPGWPMPIHTLFVKTGVTVFFQGHDHLYARQELDGVIYQSCPIPAGPTYTAFNRESYRSGVVLPNSGHLRVTVSPEKVLVDYVSSYLPADETSNKKNRTIAHSYTILPR